MAGVRTRPSGGKEFPHWLPRRRWICADSYGRQSTVVVDLSA
jgi:hypothetical protein